MTSIASAPLLRWILDWWTPRRPKRTTFRSSLQGRLLRMTSMNSQEQDRLCLPCLAQNATQSSSMIMTLSMADCTGATLPRPPPQSVQPLHACGPFHPPPRDVSLMPLQPRLPGVRPASQSSMPLSLRMAARCSRRSRRMATAPRRLRH